MSESIKRSPLAVEVPSGAAPNGKLPHEIEAQEAAAAPADGSGEHIGAAVVAAAEARSAATGPAPSAQEAAMFCTRCGTRNTLDANYCRQCGKRLERLHPPLPDEAFDLGDRPEERVSDLLVLAFKRSENGDLEGAIKACGDALHLMPNSTSAHSLMGMLYEKQGSRDKAIAEFETVLALNPGSIADREKLDQLKDGSTIRLTPARIITSRKIPSRVLFEGSAAPVVAAAAVFLLVLGVGAWAVWARGGRAIGAPSQSGASAAARQATTGFGGPIPRPQDAAASIQQTPGGASLGGAQAAQGSQGSQPGALAAAGGALPQGAGGQPYSMQREARRAAQGGADADVPPAPVELPRTSLLERFPRLTQRGEQTGTIHLPEGDQNPVNANNSASPQTGQPGANQNPTSQLGSPQPGRNPGRIEIVVTPAGGGGAGLGGSTPSSAKSGGDSGATMDSRARLAVAQQAQLGGNYRQAVREYLKALDGAGDETARIQQQVGQCYQRLDEKDSAIAHFNDAIAEYKKQISAGRNVESSQRGVKLCEAAIRSMQ